MTRKPLIKRREKAKPFKWTYFHLHLKLRFCIWLPFEREPFLELRNGLVSFVLSTIDELHREKHNNRQIFPKPSRRSQPNYTKQSATFHEQHAHLWRHGYEQTNKHPRMKSTCVQFTKIPTLNCYLITTRQT